MGVFYHEEPPNHSKRCKYLATTLKEVFFHCQTFRRRLSFSSLEEEYSISDFDEEQEVYIHFTILFLVTVLLVPVFTSLFFCAAFAGYCLSS